jgi:hypothetical protein
VTAFELIKRAYDSSTLEKLRDFMTIESLELQPDAVIYKSPCPPIRGAQPGESRVRGSRGNGNSPIYYIDNEKREKAPKFVICRKQGLVPST